MREGWSGWVHAPSPSLFPHQPSQLKGKCKCNNLDVDDRVGGFKLGGFLLDVGIEYCVPVLLVSALDGKTVPVVFSETG